MRRTPADPIKSGEKTQDKQTVKFEGARFVVVGVVCFVIKLSLRFLFSCIRNCTHHAALIARLHASARR